jgi:hypothetical protein
VASAGSNTAIDAAVRIWVKGGPLPAFTYSLVDLNDDGILDAVVLLNDPRYCGSGGCTLLILAGTASGFDVLSSSTVVRGLFQFFPQINIDGTALQYMLVVAVFHLPLCFFVTTDIDIRRTPRRSLLHLRRTFLELLCLN